MGSCGFVASCSEYGPVAVSCECGNETSRSMKENFLTSWGTISLSRRALLHRVRIWCL